MTTGHSRGAMKAAADWYVRLTSGNASQADHQAWRQWQDERSENADAWQRVEAVTGKFGSIPPAIGMAALNQVAAGPHSSGRRRALKQLGLLIAAGAAGGLAYRQEPWAEVLADYSTGIGERREIVLADGTHLYLNTATSIDVSFDADRRSIKLIKGEVLIQTGHEQFARYRSFVLTTDHGAVTALGTRFSVRHFDDYSLVTVFEHAVEIVPKQNESARLILREGEAMAFDTAAMLTRSVADPASVAWSQGFLVVDQMPLSEFLAELARYRNGILRCDPAIAKLSISGSFPLGDTDAALAALTDIFPVRIDTFTRYWISVIPA